MQPVPTIKSRPVYPVVQVDPSVAYHLFIAGAGAFPSLSELYNACDGERSCWVIGESLQHISYKYPKGCHFIDESAMQETFSKLFATLPISANLYLASKQESMLWDIHRLAVNAGLGQEQIKKLEPLSNKRRLFCTHCYTLTDGVTYTPYECPGCKRLLLVRDHFSKLHSAYVGVQINAEDPSDIPEREELI